MNFQQDHLESPARQALLILTYCALFLFIGAATSGLILADEFGELPVRASRRSNLIQRGLFEKGSLDLLQSYGAKQSSVWVITYCKCLHSSCRGVSPSSSQIVGLFSLIAGIVSLLAQVLLYVMLEESPAAKITLSVVGLYAVLPLLHLIPRPWGSNRRNNIVNSY
jgi:hypothetical protein